MCVLAPGVSVRGWLFDIGESRRVSSVAELEALYGEVPVGATKERTELHPFHQELFTASPFCAFATVGPEWTDCTPRGDGPAFVKGGRRPHPRAPGSEGQQPTRLAAHIIEDSRVSLPIASKVACQWALVTPSDPNTLATSAVDGRRPATVICITVERAYLQCGKAMIRSQLWQPDVWGDVDGLPTTGQLSAAFRDGVDAATYDAGYEQGLRENLT